MDTKKLWRRLSGVATAAALAGATLVSGASTAHAAPSPLTITYCTGAIECSIVVSGDTVTGRAEGQSITVTVWAQPNQTVKLRAFALTWTSSGQPDTAVPIGAIATGQTDGQGRVVMSVPTSPLPAPFHGAPQSFMVQPADFTSAHWRSGDGIGTPSNQYPRFDLRSARALHWDSSTYNTSSGTTFEEDMRFGIPGQRLQMQALRGGSWVNVTLNTSGNGVIDQWGRTYVKWALPDSWPSGSYTARMVNLTKNIVLFQGTVVSYTRPKGVWGDQDGDNRADVLGVDGAGRLRVFVTKAGPSLSNGSQAGQGWGTTTWISTLPDLNGNGYSELLARRSDGTLWIYPGTSFATYGAGKQIGQGWNGMGLMTVTADVDSDKMPELFARTSTGQLRRYSVGLKGASFKNVIGEGWGSVKHLVNVGDVSGDGRADLLGVKTNGDLVRYTLSSRGIVNGTTTIGRGWNTMNFAYSPGDLDGDKLRDLVGRRSDGSLMVYKNLGKGRFTLPKKVGSGWNGMRLIA